MTREDQDRDQGKARRIWSKLVDRLEHNRWRDGHGHGHMVQGVTERGVMRLALARKAQSSERATQSVTRQCERPQLTTRVIEPQGSSGFAN